MDRKLSKVLKQLRTDPFDPTLKTHKLTGYLDGVYSCSLSHEVRILFTITGDTIHLMNIGRHEDVY
ncbi:MAG: type II toxin-antitoxin system mRNA interferase toxin, RelE/StbE family [Nitrospirae bacterium]|nr:type II toxin-antitoxin system mRNA interferase toxin, RelE/StbE family [Nitrospirota bacterium]